MARSTRWCRGNRAETSAWWTARTVSTYGTYADGKWNDNLPSLPECR